MTRRLFNIAALLSPLLPWLRPRKRYVDTWRCKCGTIRFGDHMRYGWANHRGAQADYHSVSECQPDVTVWAQEELDALLRKAGMI